MSRDCPSQKRSGEPESERLHAIVADGPTDRTTPNFELTEIGHFSRLTNEKEDHVFVKLNSGSLSGITEVRKAGIQRRIILTHTSASILL
jgi:hypothetical protein